MKMKMLKVLLVATISFLCVRTTNAQQQCSAPGTSEVYNQSQPFPPACPASGPTKPPYTLIPVNMTGTATFTCTSTANAVSPPGPNVIYWSWYEANNAGTSGGPQTGYGDMYCNTNNAPYASYFCSPIVTSSYTVATSPSDYNRFYNRAFTYFAQNGVCVEETSDYTQDFEQCPGLACNSQPCQQGSPPYCGQNASPSWDPSSCSWSCVPNGNSPIIVDVSGEGFQLTSAAGGVSYNISGNGAPVKIAWTAPGAQNAFLCLPDGNGSCNSGKQLFGNFTPQPKSSTPNGFAALAMYDTPASGGNGDGVIDARDAIFSSLRLWIDANHDGVTQPNELFTLPQLGITSISLSFKWDQRTDQYGNVFRYRAQVGSASGAGRMAYDVFFVTQPSGTTAKNTLKTCPPARAIGNEGGASSNKRPVSFGTQ